MLIPTQMATPCATFSANEILTVGGPDITVIFLAVCATVDGILEMSLEAVMGSILKI